MKHIYTIGHSIYGSENFVKLLQKNSVNTLVDVRSTPYSKFAPQYNRESLRKGGRAKLLTFYPSRVNFMGQILSNHLYM